MNDIVFADTEFFVAVTNERDSWHEKATQFGSRFDGLIVTSQWVLAEFANFCSRLKNRDRAIVFIDNLLIDPGIEFVSATADWFDMSWQLYRGRPDKEWSLTDCISFEVMRQRNIREALTSDRHFEQAGFQIFLK